MKKGVRQFAFEILCNIYENNAFSNLTIDAVLNNSEKEIDERDKKLLTNIVYGTVERTITLDYITNLYLDKPIQNLPLEPLVILRMSAYQLIFMDRIPPYAIIDEAVKIIKYGRAPHFANLVNAVLRKVNGYDVNDIDLIKDVSIKYSCPQHLINMWAAHYGNENMMGIVKSMNGPVPVCAHVNTLKCTENKFIRNFERSGGEAQRTALENALIITYSGAITQIQEFQEGWFHVQDMASQYCAQALDPKSGDLIFDMCSAPGGKAFTMAELMENEGEIRCFDVYPQRLSLIDEGARRLGIDIIKTMENDAAQFNSALPMADKILCDVPCSGLGTIRKKPEIRYKNLDYIDTLPAIQYQILETSSKYLKPGGTLVYSTCSLNKKENDQVVDRFLNENSDFEAVDVLPSLRRGIPGSKYLTLFPHIHDTDGFFIAKLVKKR